MTLTYIQRGPALKGLYNPHATPIIGACNLWQAGAYPTHRDFCHGEMHPRSGRRNESAAGPVRKEPGKAENGPNRQDFLVCGEGGTYISAKSHLPRPVWPAFSFSSGTSHAITVK